MVVPRGVLAAVRAMAGALKGDSAGVWGVCGLRGWRGRVGVEQGRFGKAVAVTVPCGVRTVAVAAVGERRAARGEPGMARLYRVGR